MSPSALLRAVRRAPPPSHAERRSWNETDFRERIRLECARTDRSGNPFSLLVLSEPDRTAAVAIARRVGARIRETDEMGRMGPDRLGVLLTDTPRDGATQVAGELAKLLRQDRLLLPAPAVYTYPGDWIEAEVGTQAYGSPPPVPPYPEWKRAMDLAGAALAILILLPLIVAVALAVGLSSPGPVLFRQPRIGYGGRPFAILKFRTMTHGAGDALHARYVADLVAGRAEAGESGEFKLRDDPRITPVGALLRRWSLDELPQLVNVLRGEMALVGPRPEPFYARTGYAGWYHRRVLATKPGITGPWQVAGRSRVSYETMVRMDLRYARTPTPVGDVGLLVRTVRAVLQGDGAC
jgi:lipopolysaccharide/colanic/teichoic acid biosynthesis glycosyltransferase